LTTGPRAAAPRASLPALGLVALTLLLAPRQARGDDRDPWFGRDKALHFGASALLASGGYAATAFFTEDRRVRLAVGGGFAFSLGVAKELWDLSGHGDASWRDLTWDAVGTVTGLAVATAIDWTIARLTAPTVARAP
jgi:putative lipoprotein